jgi:hypothetical protein
VSKKSDLDLDVSSLQAAIRMLDQQDENLFDVHVRAMMQMHAANIQHWDKHGTAHPALMKITRYGDMTWTREQSEVRLGHWTAKRLTRQHPVDGTESEWEAYWKFIGWQVAESVGLT